MKVIAFYLPQYHPIKENNEWWGEGFTEWTNVSKARPLYTGHYQPQIPADLGFYDLRLEETRVSQAKLAKAYGIDAFCYYHYWFNGKMLLERPFNEVLESGKPDHEFCLCWANENWTRRWDGMEQELLIKQDYEEYDPASHIEWLAKAFQDKRYIKVDGKPLFLIYRASDIPNLNEVILKWRQEIKKHGFEDIYVCCANNSQNILSVQDIIDAGFDAIYEFAPNLKNVHETQSISTIPGLNIYSYQDLVERDINKLQNQDIPTFPCVFPSWDNTPRRHNNATIIQNEDELLYANWLKHSIEKAKKNKKDEQIVFINAWNEWGEGCHLEPDQKHGKKFLEATKKVLLGSDVVSEIDESREEIHQIAHYKNTKISTLRPIYIWGTGSSGKHAFNLLKENSIKIAGFIDSNPERVGQEFLGSQIYSKSVLLEQFIIEQKPFVCIASMFYDEIEPVLLESGYKTNVDFIKNITKANIRRQKHAIHSWISFEYNTYCNICGFNRFSNGNKYDHKMTDVCEKCGSVSYERMIVDILSGEVGQGGRPLSEWVDCKHINILNLDAVSKEVPFLDYVFLNKNLQLGHSNENTLITENIDYLLAVFDDTVNQSIFLKFIEENINNIGKAIVLIKDKKRKKQIHSELSKRFTVGIVEREIERFRTGEQVVLLISCINLR